MENDGEIDGRGLIRESSENDPGNNVIVCALVREWTRSNWKGYMLHRFVTCESRMCLKNGKSKSVLCVANVRHIRVMNWSVSFGYGQVVWRTHS